MSLNLFNIYAADWLLLNVRISADVYREFKLTEEPNFSQSFRICVDSTTINYGLQFT